MTKVSPLLLVNCRPPHVVQVLWSWGRGGGQGLDLEWEHGGMKGCCSGFCGSAFPLETARALASQAVLACSVLLTLFISLSVVM